MAKLHRNVAYEGNGCISVWSPTLRARLTRSAELKFTEERFIRNKKAAFLPFTCRGTLKTFNNFKIVIFGLQPQFFASIAIGVE